MGIAIPAVCTWPAMPGIPDMPAMGVEAAVAGVALAGAALALGAEAGAGSLVRWRPDAQPSAKTASSDIRRRVVWLTMLRS